MWLEGSPWLSFRTDGSRPVAAPGDRRAGRRASPGRRPGWEDAETVDELGRGTSRVVLAQPVVQFGRRDEGPAGRESRAKLLRLAQPQRLPPIAPVPGFRQTGRPVGGTMLAPGQPRGFLKSAVKDGFRKGSGGLGRLAVDSEPGWSYRRVDYVCRRVGDARLSGRSGRGAGRPLLEGESMEQRQFSFVAEIRTTEWDALRPILEATVGPDGVTRSAGRAHIRGTMTGPSAKDLHRHLLAVVRRTVRTASVRSEWTADGGNQERFFDYVYHGRGNRNPRGS